MPFFFQTASRHASLPCQRRRCGEGVSLDIASHLRPNRGPKKRKSNSRWDWCQVVELVLAETEGQFGERRLAKPRQEMAETKAAQSLARTWAAAVGAPQTCRRGARATRESCKSQPDCGGQATPPIKPIAGRLHLELIQELVEGNAGLTKDGLQSLRRNCLVLRNSEPHPAPGQPNVRTSSNPIRLRALTASSPEISRGSFTRSPEQGRLESASGLSGALRGRRSGRPLPP